MKKDATFAGKPPTKALSRAEEAMASLDVSEPPEPMKRLTIEIPKSLHRRVKLQCVADGISIAELVRTYLDKKFPDMS